MLRKTLSIILACTMLAGTGSGQERKTTIKEKVLDIPLGTFVEVRTKAKEKIRGRLGEATDDGFGVKVAKVGGPEVRQIAYADARSIKVAKAVEPSTGVKAASTSGKVLLGVLAAGGAVVLVAMVAVAAGGGF
jgi:hypothetical protein